MCPWLSQAGAARRSRRGEAPRTGRPARWACWAVCLLVLAAGCSKHRREVEEAEVTGKVLYKGKPLPGGRVTFVTTQGAFANTGTIDENGNYKINSPVGEVRIGVDNTALASPAGRGGKGGRGPGAGAKSHPRPPGAAAPEEMKGHYVSIPSKYADPAESGLTYTVTAGTQTHDIKLE